MSLTINIHYTGEDGAAHRFVEEMEATDRVQSRIIHSVLGPSS